MTDRDAFIASILAHPHDTRLRLVFADWLDDNNGLVVCPECKGWGTTERPKPGPPPKIEERIGPDERVQRFAVLPPIDTRELIRRPPPCPCCDGARKVPNGYAEWAEFIRVQVEVSRREAVERSQRMILFDDAEFNDLLAREQELWMDGPFRTLREQWQASFHRKAVILPQDLGSGDPTPAPWLIVRDGFPSEWRGPLADWYGVRCEHCCGLGQHPRGLEDPIQWCLVCNKTGRIHAGGPEIVGRWPITQVTVTDQQAYPALRSERVAWFHSDVPTGSERRIQDLPNEVFNALVGWDNRGGDESQVKWYATRAKANDALSDALLHIARTRAAAHSRPSSSLV